VAGRAAQGHLVLLALRKPGQRNTFAIARPNTGALDGRLDT
jgi:hypothetical protein